MQRAVLLLGAFVPGLGSLPIGRFDEVEREIAAVLPRDQAALLIAIPDDEMLLVVTWHAGRAPDASDGTLIVEAVTQSGLGAEVQRMVRAHLIVAGTNVSQWRERH